MLQITSATLTLQQMVLLYSVYRIWHERRCTGWYFVVRRGGCKHGV